MRMNEMEMFVSSLHMYMCSYVEHYDFLYEAISNSSRINNEKKVLEKTWKFS